MLHDKRVNNQGCDGKLSEKVGFKIMIFYFTGTGNCLNAARQIGARLGEQVAPLRKALNMNLSTEKRIGFVYPTYNFLAPKVVTDIIRQLDLPKDAYYFAIGPVGAQVGNSLWQVKKILEEKGCRLAYSNKIRVPDNSAIAFGRNPNNQAWKFSKFAERWNGILSDLEKGSQELHYAWWDPTAPIVNQQWIVKHIYNALRPNTNAEKCNGCGICAEVCPVGNIKMENKCAIHNDKCEFCLACVHFCPAQATEFKNKPAAKESQYHHPEVKWKDLK